ncbi:MAG: T9SS type A sorting domain-containing protein, partial [Saprospiraceae bacterium]|nr:T9SS type A sorting domain-containing protein [Saprospiraceae bacterium]
QVVLPLTENFTFRLVDSAGNVLFSHYQIFGENQVNLSHLKADKYFVEISSDKGKIVEKITKT